MSEPSEQPAPAKPDEAMMSVEAFQSWVGQPRNAAEWARFLENLELPELPADAPPELVAAWQALAEKHRVAQAVKAIQQKMKALLEVMSRPAGTMQAEERLAQCQALVSELTDAMLETPEPHRSTLLKKLLPLRERIKALRVEE